MTVLGDLYTDFIRIDLDSRGGYSRVAQVQRCGQKGYPKYCAFKLMRHEIDFYKGMDRFSEELRLLALVNKDKKAPISITRAFDSGFVSKGLSFALHQNNIINLDEPIISTHLDIEFFLNKGKELQTKKPGHWLPYLAVELAQYDDSLFRRMYSRSKGVLSGTYRLPTGEIIAIAVQLLETMDYLHSNYYRAYMDWKPEHIFWNGVKNQVKLIDWNVTIPLDDGPGKTQNIRDDLRLFCGAVLYSGLTFIDPDNPSQPIGPRPLNQIQFPIHPIRRRYWTDNPDFYQQEKMLDDRIKQIVRRGLDPNQGFDSTEELKYTLLEYAQQELGLKGNLPPNQDSPAPYFKALSKIHAAQEHLLQAQWHLIEATKVKGATLEFNRLIESVRRALMNLP